MKANQRMGRGVAQEELAIAREKQRTKRLKIKEEGRTARERAKILKAETEARVSKYKAQQKVAERERAKREKFVKAVESQNVRGIIPPVEERGMHKVVVFNAFSVPEKELERDSRTGLLSVKENNPQPKRNIWM